MLIEIELVGKASRWSYEQPRIRIGRDPSCDLSLPEYSMVSREHLALEVSGASLSLTDTRSANGTYLNGARVTAAAITSGDRLRLGAEGPELRIYFKEIRPQATVLEGAAAAVSPGATMFERSPMAVPAGEQQGSERASRVSFGSAPESSPADAPSAMPNNAIPEGEPGADIVIERKLTQIRNLLAVNLAGLLILLFAMFYQGQQIAKNKDAVADLKKGAESAVQQFTPALDARLSTFEKRMDGMDAKMKEAEDRFIERMNRQLPLTLDAYVNRKMEEVKRQADKYQR